jgi:ketosteroid isomerase-like protein
MHRDEVLFANEAFYLAFSEGDLTAMDNLWADRGEVVCLHPGWPALTDRELVMESWARILRNPDRPRVTAHPVEAVSLGDAMLVVCYEQMGDTVMVASNVFVAGPDGPRVVAHQAGLCSEPPELPALIAPEFDA